MIYQRSTSWMNESKNASELEQTVEEKDLGVIIIWDLKSHTIQYDDEDLTCAKKLTENCQFNLADGAKLK